MGTNYFSVKRGLEELDPDTFWDRRRDDSTGGSVSGNLLFRQEIQGFRIVRRIDQLKFQWIRHFSLVHKRNKEQI